MATSSASARSTARRAPCWLRRCRPSTRAAVAVKATLFDKTPDANWRVAWHQDRAVAVRERIDVEGWGPWSVKHGTPHAEPPAHVLARMLAMRRTMRSRRCGGTAWRY